MPPHFLTGAELSADQLTSLLDRALSLKSAPASSRALEGRSVALWFEKPSTRTRVSFEAGVVGSLAGIEVRVAAPDGYQLSAADGATLTDDPQEAVAGADAVYTDVWVSLSDHPDEAARRREPLAPYRLHEGLL